MNLSAYIARGGALTPGRFNIRPDTGVIIPATTWQKMLDASAEAALYVPAGEYRLDGLFNLQGGTKIRLHPAAHINLSYVPTQAASVCFSAAGSLSSPYALSADAYALQAAPPWLKATAYLVNDRVCTGGMFFRCTSAHTSDSPVGGESGQRAFWRDYQAGRWEPTNLKSAADLSAIAPGDWLSLQSSTARFDTQGLFNMLGETVAVDSVAGDMILLRDLLHYDITTATGGKFHKLNTLKDIEIRGGRFTGPVGDPFDNTTLFAFNVCENVKFDDIDASSFYAICTLNDTIDFKSRGCHFHDGYSLGYGWAIGNGSRNVQISNNTAHRLRHFMTISAAPNRPVPHWITVDGFDVECSSFFRPGDLIAGAPLGTPGDAIDSHAGCRGLHLMNGTIRTASGAGVHFEGCDIVCENVTVDGANVGAAIVNNTTIPSRVSLKNFKAYNCAVGGVKIRAPNNLGRFASIEVEAEIDGVGALACHIAGDVANRLPNVTSSLKVRGTAGGTYAVLVAYADNPSIEAQIDTSLLAGQHAIGIFNCVGALVTLNGVRQKEGATGTVVLHSTVNNSATAGQRTNFGNGVLTLADPPTRGGVVDGLYIVRFSSSTTFAVYDPDGVSVGTGTLGTAWTIQVAFTIAAGGVAFVAGDGFLLTVDSDTVAVSTSAENTGADTITVPTSNVADTMSEGRYLITCQSIAGGAGNETWSVLDPTGNSVGTATTGVEFSTNGVTFTINDAEPHAAVGDRFIFVGTRVARGGRTRLTSIIAPNHSTNRAVFLGNQVKEHAVDIDWDRSQVNAQITLGSGGGHKVRESSRSEVLAHTANWTYVLWSNASVIRETGPLTADRTMVLPTFGVPDQKEITLINASTGGHNWLMGAKATVPPDHSGSIVWSEAAADWLLKATA